MIKYPNERWNYQAIGVPAHPLRSMLVVDVDVLCRKPDEK